MKRVVHLSTVHPADDVRIFVKECRSLAAAGYDVTLIARSPSDYVKQGVKVIAVNPRTGGRLARMVLSTFDVLGKAWRCRADFYHFHDPELMPVGAILRLTGAKVVYDVHEDVPRQLLSKDWIPAPLRKTVAGGIEAMEWLTTRLIFTDVVAATPPIADRIPPAKTTIVHNYPIAGELTPTAVTLPQEQRPPYVVYAGGLTRVRGALEMVKAFEYVETPGANCILAGEFTEEGLEDEARALNGWARVQYRGLLDRSQMADLLAGARAGLVVLHDVPNYVVSYPIKMFEYMSAGIPVIASDFPLWRSIIDSERCGLLVDQKDPVSIAKAIDWILTHPEEAERMGQRGKAAVAAKYNWGVEERKLLAVYEAC